MPETETAKPAASTQPEKTNAQQAKPAEEKQTNCLACNKPIKKLKRYYRNGKFYCNKKCWRKTLKAKEKEETK
ncbi:MAG: hypothetical protein NTW64_00975 [Candidatus Omnitrophica bacterium]|nr:hypothetical protein [Candidatus Omnitrophota bacterium]